MEYRSPYEASISALHHGDVGPSRAAFSSEAHDDSRLTAEHTEMPRKRQKMNGSAQDSGPALQSPPAIEALSQPATAPLEPTSPRASGWENHRAGTNLWDPATLAIGAAQNKIESASHNPDSVRNQELDQSQSQTILNGTKPKQYARRGGALNGLRKFSRCSDTSSRQSAEGGGPQTHASGQSNLVQKPTETKDLNFNVETISTFAARRHTKMRSTSSRSASKPSHCTSSDSDGAFEEYDENLHGQSEDLGIPKSRSDPLQRKERPTRAAGMSASSRINSQFERPFNRYSDFESNYHSRYAATDNRENSVSAARSLSSVQPSHQRQRYHGTDHTSIQVLDRDDLRVLTDLMGVFNLSNLRESLLGKTGRDAQDVRIQQHGLLIAADSPAHTTMHGAQDESLHHNHRKVQATSHKTLEPHFRDPNHKIAYGMASSIRQRQLGKRASQHELQNKVSQLISPWRSFVGASHDVSSVAWAMNSTQFVAGAIAHTNDEDLHYNRPCNLLLGDLENNTLLELPDHCVDRRRPQEVESGPNRNMEVFQACDPKVYMTVTSARFSPFEKRMYSASEDCCVKVWDISNAKKPECMTTLRHHASVQMLDVSTKIPGLFAAGCKSTSQAICVYRSQDLETTEAPLSLSSSRAESRPDWLMYPECISLGKSPYLKHLLLGGFLQWGREEDGIKEGHLCLWDVMTSQCTNIKPGSQAIHTVAWHPFLPYFASGGLPSLQLTQRHGTKTVVRTWNINATQRATTEFECPATEMTDVTFHPLDDNIMTAGCTDRKSYVWDRRWPSDCLHILEHGKSIMPRGERDTGVMMSLWGPDGSSYYTGSSDGSVFAWDLRRHPADVMVDHIAHVGAGIQSGQFSPDGTHLLIGDAIGGVHVLSSAPWGHRPGDDDDPSVSGIPMSLIRTSDDSRKQSEPCDEDDNPGTEGIEAAANLLESGQIEIHPLFGAAQGPVYQGPWAKCYREDDPADGPAEGVGRMRREVYQKQAVSRRGRIRPSNAVPLLKLTSVRKERLEPPTSPMAMSSSEGAEVVPRRTSESDTESEGEWWPLMNEEEIGLAREDPTRKVGPIDLCFDAC